MHVSRGTVRHNLGYQRTLVRRGAIDRISNTRSQIEQLQYLKLSRVWVRYTDWSDRIEPTQNPGLTFIFDLRPVNSTDRSARFSWDDASILAKIILGSDGPKGLSWCHGKFPHLSGWPVIGTPLSAMAHFKITLCAAKTTCWLPRDNQWPSAFFQTTVPRLDAVSIPANKDGLYFNDYQFDGQDLRVLGRVEIVPSFSTMGRPLRHGPIGEHFQSILTDLRTILGKYYVRF